LRVIGISRPWCIDCSIGTSAGKKDVDGRDKHGHDGTISC
jgi:hypothetical protein